MAKSTYLRGGDFPHEGFVQRAIEGYFSGLCFKAETGGHADLVCAHSETGERWLVEAKGLTKAVGLDFRTGLGQLVQRMADESCNYAVAVPDIPQFVKQCRAVSTGVRRKLRIHWLLVGPDGSVRRVDPEDDF